MNMTDTNTFTLALALDRIVGEISSSTLDTYLEGILIATTNMTECFDPAFERRFLYKVLFKKPTTGVKAKIWKSMVDGITDSDAESLAAEYSFTGGQIENIIRKLDVDYILYGTSPDLEKIHFLCKSEGIRKENNRKAIGF